MKVWHLLFVLAIFSLASCVSTKKFNAANMAFNQLQSDENHCQDQLYGVLLSNKKLSNRESALEDERAELKGELDLANNRNAQLENTVKDLSAVSQQQTESEKTSEETLRAKEAVIESVQSVMMKRDSLDKLIVTALTASFDSLQKAEFVTTIEYGNVCINMPDSAFFKGYYLLPGNADSILSKIAVVMDSFPDFEFRVEGFTDSIETHNNCIEDNWDLSAWRAAAVARALQTRYHIQPERIIAAGMGAYTPVPRGDSSSGNYINRHIRIVILIPSDQLFRLLANK